jgi:acyl-CoA thioesterase
VNYRDDLALTALGEGRYQGMITRRWWIVTGPNGGLLAGLLLRAVEDLVRGERPELSPRTMTVQFLAGPDEGPVDLAAAVERAGRRVAFTTVDMRQGGKVICQAKVTFGADLDTAFDLVDHRRPDVPPASAAPWFDPATTYGEARRRWDRRPVELAEPGTVTSWLRLDEPGVPVDAAVMALMCDNLPPSLRAHEPDPERADQLHTTTIEYTVYFRAPDPGLSPEDHCLVILRSQTVSGGYHQEDGEVWSPDGRLLATSRQLALVFRRD